MRFLVVEDDAQSRDDLFRFLAMRGHETVAVSNGELALEIIENGTPFDYVISDHDMEGMSGVDLLRKVRGNSGTRKIPFALMSGGLYVVQGEPELLRDACPRLGATFWQKPLDFSVLIDSLEAHLRE